MENWVRTLVRPGRDRARLAATSISRAKQSGCGVTAVRPVAMLGAAAVREVWDTGVETKVVSLVAMREPHGASRRGRRDYFAPPLLFCMENHECNMHGA
jgi:hypothetical protein